MNSSIQNSYFELARRYGLFWNTSNERVTKYYVRQLYRILVSNSSARFQILNRTCICRKFHEFVVRMTGPISCLYFELARRHGSYWNANNLELLNISISRYTGFRCQIMIKFVEIIPTLRSERSI